MTNLLACGVGTAVGFMVPESQLPIPYVKEVAAITALAPSVIGYRYVPRVLQQAALGYLCGTVLRQGYQQLCANPSNDYVKGMCAMLPKLK